MTEENGKRVLWAASPIVFAALMGFMVYSCSTFASRVQESQERHQTHRQSQMQDCRDLCNGHVRSFSIDPWIGAPVCVCE